MEYITFKGMDGKNEQQIDFALKIIEGLKERYEVAEKALVAAYEEQIKNPTQFVAVGYAKRAFEYDLHFLRLNKQYYTGFKYDSEVLALYEWSKFNLNRIVGVKVANDERISAFAGETVKDALIATYGRRSKNQYIEDRNEFKSMTTGV